MKETPVSMQTIQRRSTAALILLNVLGAMAMTFYLNVIDPLPADESALQELNQVVVISTAAVLVITFALGWLWARKAEKRIETWYGKLQAGTPADQVSKQVRRDVLDAPIRSAIINGTMWLLVGISSGLGSQSWRFFWAITGVAGLLTTIVLYFVFDILWRPLLPVFFPNGQLSQVRAFRLGVLGRLLIVFLLVGLYPPALLVGLTWPRAQALTIASNPEAILQNLFALQIFILVAGILISVGLALFTTHGITGPLDKLQVAMKRVERNDLDAHVAVTSNDELGYLSERFNQMTSGLRQGEMLRNLLNLYVSPEVAREALEHGAQLGGRQVECTVLFSDIRGFTSLSERLAPQTLIDVLNRYMVAMVEVIVENGGIVNKFGGDSLLAIFGTPLNPAQDHAACAVRAAMGMQSALVRFNESQAAHQLPTLHIGIGIATGPVIAGNVGGRERIEYTVIGDTVNLASRLQDKTKDLDADILLSRPACEQAQAHMSIDAECLPPIPVKGKQAPVDVYALKVG
ncbi:MAG: HAMP domain-containing protein [Anaerolineae bacterium]|nr:HAMP domain-containing protein [Anaerolineae bacterium]